MNKKPMDSSQKQKKRDPDLAAAEIAMKRAALKAREKARQVDAGVVVLKNGQLIEERQDSSA